MNDFPIVDSVIEILGMVIHSSSLFFVPKLDREICEAIKFREFSNQDGDFFFFRNIYNQFMSYFLGRRRDEMRNWVRQHYLNFKALHQVRELVTEINTIIKKFPVNYDKLKT